MVHEEEHKMRQFTHLRQVDADIPREAVWAHVLAHRFVDDDCVEKPSPSNLGHQGGVHARYALSETLPHFLGVAG
jgi:hypothetical protein